MLLHIYNSMTLLVQGNLFTALLCSMILSAFFIKSLYQKLIVKGEKLRKQPFLCSKVIYFVLCGA